MASKCRASRSGGQRIRRRAQPSKSISVAAVFNWSPASRTTDRPSSRSNHPPRLVLPAQSSKVRQASLVRIARSPPAPPSSKDERESGLSDDLIIDRLQLVDHNRKGYAGGCAETAANVPPDELPRTATLWVERRAHKTNPAFLRTGGGKPTRFNSRKLPLPNRLYLRAEADRAP